jgi:tetratricopeptide (TPR) repeat protein
MTAAGTAVEAVAARHLWITAPSRAARGALLAGAPLTGQPVLPVVDAHRRLRGPYTAAGTIVRVLALTALERRPDLVERHEIELLTVAPDLRASVPARRATLTSLAAPLERTRYYSRARTLRLAHGLAEFLRDLAADTGTGTGTGTDGVGPAPWTLVVENVHAADQTDQELLAVLLRRLNPETIQLVLCGAADESEPFAEPLLVPALARYAVTVAAPPAGPVSGGGPLTPDRAPELDGPGDPGLAELAHRYIQGDCVDDDPRAHAAYQALAATERERLHDTRARELIDAGEPSHLLGAVPYHLERGAQPAQKGAQALWSAADQCLLFGFYAASVDFSRRAMELVSWQSDAATRWTLIGKLASALAAYGRPEEAEPLYQEAMEVTIDPMIHLSCAYALAMLYTRHLDAERRDHHHALAQINVAVALASQLPDLEERAFQTVFNQNGRALIENHLGRPEKALQLVTEGLRRLDEELPPDRHRLHRSVLRHNRAQVLAGLGRLDEALVDFQTVIAMDPDYPEYHFDVAALLHRLGRGEEALAEYTTAIRLGPPFPELYYNRGDLRAALDDTAGALEDFSYVLELDPDRVDALVNRAGILLYDGQNAAARADVEAGLALDPDHPHLWCLLGRILLDQGEDGALDALNRAVTAAPDLLEAWATRAAYWYGAGDFAAAVEDFTRALELDDDAAIRFNRGVAYQRLGAWNAALADFDHVTDALPQDPDAWLRRAACRLEVGDTDGSRSDLDHFLELAPDRAQEAGSVGAGKSIHAGHD